MGRVVIHCEPGIDWQAKRAPYFAAGLEALGIPCEVSNSRQRESDVAVLLGTTCWRAIEASGSYLLVDRASYGDPDFVQLVWNGHGRRGDHKVPADRHDRWPTLPCPEIKPWRDDPYNRLETRVVMCGQTESWSPHWATVEEWYRDVAMDCTDFRCHPAGDNPTRLPNATTWHDVRRVVTLNSSVGVECVLRGIPTVTMDEAAMAWEVTGHDPRQTEMPDRGDWLHWLSWTQWHWDEIREGAPIRHLFEEL